MPSAFGGLIALCIGMYLFVGREWIARSAFEWDQLAFGFRSDPKWYEIGSVLGALLLIGLGLLGLLDVIHLAPQF